VYLQEQIPKKMCAEKRLDYMLQIMITILG
jgi:hypothetical protein